MQQQTKGSIMINGLGSSNGGDFQDVVINGMGTIKSHVHAEYCEVNGHGTFEGTVTGERLKINGNASLKDFLQVEQCFIEGNAKIAGDIHTKILNVAGNTTIKGNVKSDTIKIEGRTKILGHCSAESFYVQGPLLIGGELNAEDIVIEPMFSCKIAEIGCRSIQVKYHVNPFWNLLHPILPTSLVTDIIEGDDIHLEYTKAKVVRGKNVFIGEKCEIDLVEYTTDFQKAPSAKVKTYRQI